MSKPAEGETPRTDALQAMQPVGTVWLEHARTLESELQAAEERLRAAERDGEAMRDELAKIAAIVGRTGDWHELHNDVAALQHDSGKE